MNESGRTGEVLPEGTVIKDEFTTTIHASTWADRLGAVPWIAVLEGAAPHWRHCEALTSRNRQCRRNPRFLYITSCGSAVSFCQEHTQDRLHSPEETARLEAWEERVGLESDRYISPGRDGAAPCP